MNRSRVAAVTVGMSAVVTVLAAGALALPAPPPATTPLVVTAEVDGIIQPVVARIHRNARSSAPNVRPRRSSSSRCGRQAGWSIPPATSTTPSSHAKTPVAVFVGPSGNRAASAGFLITMAADVAAMAPGTHIGAAHPVSGDGEKMDETMAKKMASDIAGYGRTLATQRKRNVELVEQAVTESRSFTEQEALNATPPLIDLVANDVPDLLRKLDGRTRHAVRRARARRCTLPARPRRARST